MKLSNLAIQEFKEVYLRKTGMSLSDDEAQSKGWQLLSFVHSLLTNTTQDNESIETNRSKSSS